MDVSILSPREVGAAALAGLALCVLGGVVLGATWLLFKITRAFATLRGRMPVVPWRPKLLFTVYAKSRRNLLGAKPLQCHFGWDVTCM